MSTTTESTTPCLDKLTESGHVSGLPQKWRNLHFSQSGNARLAHIVGFMEGLKACDKADLAEALAKDLCDHLVYLDNYGGVTEIDDHRYANYRVILHDDGMFGGFSIGWCRLVKPETLQEILGSEKWAKNEGETGWDHLQRVKKGIGCNSELRVWHTKHGYLEYAYSFNGGLLFHGFGCNPMAVTLGKVKYWSIHT
jgi:hypothetical protein